LISTQL